MVHPVQYTTVDGLNLAYQVVGDGPIDLVLVDEWATPLEARWDVPAIAGRLNRLASFARVISFDKRGIGLSEGSASSDMATPELWVRDLVGVVDAADAQRPVVFGAHEGGPIALMYAASLPDRTDSVILVNTGARLLSAPDYPHGGDPALWEPDLDGIIDIWQSGEGGHGHIAATAHDPWWHDWYARSRRQQASPAAGLALMRMIGQVDARHIVGSVGAPTLVVHRRDNEWWPVGGARWLAEQLPSASLVELDGADNYWWAGDADSVVDEIERFLLGERASHATERELVTIMFTDVVDSTTQATTLGDADWRDVLDAHDAVVIAETERHGGTVVKNLGDGFLLRFDGPAAAIRAAEDLRDAVTRVGLAVRIAIHTGEAEARGDDLSGIAVHLASRLLDVADGGDVVVTGVVRGLVAGSGIEFASRGEHEFRGIPDRWEAFEVLSF